MEEYRINIIGKTAIVYMILQKLLLYLLKMVPSN